MGSRPCLVLLAVDRYPLHLLLCAGRLRQRDSQNAVLERGGDFVLVEKTDSVRNGDIVVALVDGTEATLKRYYADTDGRVRLQPANSGMAPIFVDPSNLQIQGRVLAVMRKY